MKEKPPISLNLNLVKGKPDFTKCKRYTCKNCGGSFFYRPGKWENTEYCSPFCNNTTKKDKK